MKGFPPANFAGLTGEDFRLIAKQGFGDAWNNYAHAMAWFDGHLYVGTSRNILAMVKVNQPPPKLTFWPINAPDDIYQLDRRAQIWRYEPVQGQWEQVYQSPMVTGRSGDVVARDIGYRGCCVYQAPGDAEALPVHLHLVIVQGSAAADPAVRGRTQLRGTAAPAVGRCGQHVPVIGTVPRPCLHHADRFHRRLRQGAGVCGWGAEHL